MTKAKKLVVIGDSAFAEIAYEYFTHDSPYEVSGFSVEAPYLKRSQLFGLPIVPLEEVEKAFPPSEHDGFAAVAYGQLNRLRQRLVAITRSKGYRLASYVSSRAFVWPNSQIGEHCFIFEDNTVQPFVTLGDNIVLWSGNHIGHHSRVGSNCFISSHVVISGFCNIGDNCFFGVNSTVANNVTVGRDCWIGPGVTIRNDVTENLLFGGAESEASRVPARRFFRVKD